MAPVVPIPEDPSWPLPKFNLQIQDLEHPAVGIFLGAVKPLEVLHIAVKASYKWLHTQDYPPKRVEEILLVLRAMPGVAHTTGSNTHKQIHLSLNYVKGISKDRVHDEIQGVLVHEVVHCFQYFANGTCPSGLTEGVADFVRLRAGYSPPHWTRQGEGKEWDAGYQTTAYFLEWIESRYGVGTTLELNHCMKDTRYHRRIFKELTGRPVRKLWRYYCESLKGGDEGDMEEVSDDFEVVEVDDDDDQQVLIESK